jgi:heptaprenyl diphosphate synthase
VGPSDRASPLGTATVGGHLEAVAHVIRCAVRSTDPVVDTACTHLVRAGGKGFRPMVSVLAAAAVGEVGYRTHVAAASCELLHLSTLYHDDVIDGADLRRGAPSANRAWGERVAVLAGNRLTASAFEVAGRAGDRIPPIIASTYRQLVEGERRESQLVGRTDHDVADHLRVIDGKTASLIAAAAQVGAISAAAPRSQVDALASWGRTVGRAYQIADDLLDLTATAATTGKPAGNDVRQGVFTLPVLDAMSGSEGDELRDLLSHPPPYPRASVERVQALVRACGAIGRTTRQVDELLQQADAYLAELPAGPARDALRGLGRSVVPTALRMPQGPGTATSETATGIAGTTDVATTSIRGGLRSVADAPAPAGPHVEAFAPEPA